MNIFIFMFFMFSAFGSLFGMTEDEEESIPLLIRAVVSNDLEKVKALLKDGADPNVVYKDAPAVIFAIVGKNIEIIKLIFASPKIEIGFFVVCEGFIHPYQKLMNEHLKKDDLPGMIAHIVQYHGRIKLILAGFDIGSEKFNFSKKLSRLDDIYIKYLIETLIFDPSTNGMLSVYLLLNLVPFVNKGYVSLTNELNDFLLTLTGAYRQYSEN